MTDQNQDFDDGTKLTFLGRVVLVVIEALETKGRKACRTQTFANALSVQCPCGGFMHRMPGAWCVRCGAKVVQVQELEGQKY